MENLDTKQLLLAFSSLTGVSGREDAVAEYAATLLAPFGPVERTPLGSVICRVQPPQQNGPHLLLEAHMDEIGMITTFIDDSGFLKVASCGRMDARTLSAAPVWVHTQNGPLPGVICSTPPHLSVGQKQQTPAVADIAIDIGFDGPGAKQRIQLGDRITLAAPARLLGVSDTLVSGKALDDRSGCVAHLKALEYLVGNIPASIGLTVAFTSLEEVGGMGAKTTAYTVGPTHAISIDVSFAMTPDSTRTDCGLLGAGPMIGFAPILSDSLSRQLVALAQEQDIPYQREIMSGRTGTNMDQIATSRGGVIGGLISIPQKYMHTPIEVVDATDVENTAKLVAAYVRHLGQLEGGRS